MISGICKKQKILIEAKIVIVNIILEERLKKNKASVRKIRISSNKSLNKFEETNETLNYDKS